MHLKHVFMGARRPLAFLESENLVRERSHSTSDSQACFTSDHSLLIVVYSYAITLCIYIMCMSCTILIMKWPHHKTEKSGVAYTNIQPSTELRLSYQSGTYKTVLPSDIGLTFTISTHMELELGGRLSLSCDLPSVAGLNPLTVRT